jgi:hypothetical protein
VNSSSVRALLKSPVLYQAVGTLLGGGAVYYIGFRHGKSVMREQAIAAFEAHAEAQAMVVPESRIEEEMDAETAAWNELAALREQVGEEVFEELVEVTKANIQMDQAEPSEAVRQTIFADDGDVWDWAYEVEVRNGNAGPYVIRREEYIEETDEMYTQCTATWYEQDQMLYDDAGMEPIFNWSDRLGDLHFGHGSGDPNVVYIRNPDESLEWEVMRHTGSASEEVLGIAPGEPSGG